MIEIVCSANKGASCHGVLRTCRSGAIHNLPSYS